MLCTRRKRLQLSRVLFLLSGVLLCTIYQLSIRARLAEPWPAPVRSEDPGEGSTDVSEDAAVWTLEEPITYIPVLELSDPTTSLSTSTKVELSTETTSEVTTSTTTEFYPSPSTKRTIVHCIYVEPDPPKRTTTPPPALVPSTTVSGPGDAPHMKGDYPYDIFSVEDRRRGWVCLHIFGMVYMFVSLAIVCDEFFVPALGVITDKLAISDDVAGATFMAAGGSAPELFTSLIGVFISHSNVGIGTIVGSAVFNILFVIGMCAVFSREMLHLTWWPLFRDVSFYILDLIMLIIFFLDNTIMWWESMMLVAGYTLYVCFMKYNVRLERAVKYQLSKHKSIIRIIAVEPPEDDVPDVENNATPVPEYKHRLKPALQRGGSSASLHNSTMRNTIFQLMIHTLDPLGEETVSNGIAQGGAVNGEGKFKDKAEVLKNVAKGKERSKANSKDGGTNTETSKEPAPAPAKDKEEEKKEPPGDKKVLGPIVFPGFFKKHRSDSMRPVYDDVPAAGAEGADRGGDKDGGGEDGSAEDSDEDSSEDDDEDDDDDEEEEEEEEEREEEEEKEEPLSLEWPDTRRKQFTYLLLLPIVFPLWLTVPDVRNPKSTPFFGITFVGSILWIGVFSYLMVWWAHQVGETIGISEEIMGLTILAAGTSIPDLITSVIVARKGLGDMAVSSSVGSNIFDITVGLPVPWLLYSVFHGFAPVTVSSNGLFCAIVLLFLMLLFVIVSIAVCKWKMNKMLGSTMFLLYFVFLVLSVMLEDRIIICPISI